MKLIIHAGTHKTATTSFQKLCFSKKHELSKKGIFIPEFKDKTKLINFTKSRGIIPKSLTYQHNCLAWYLQLKNINEVKEFLLIAYKNAIKRNCNHILLCAEDLENILIEDCIARDIELIAKKIGFKEIQWIFVKRNPFDYLRSLYSQLSKEKKIIDFYELYKEIMSHGYYFSNSYKYFTYYVFDLDNFVASLRNDNSLNIDIIKFEDFSSPILGLPVFKKIISNEDINELSLIEEKKIEMNKSLTSNQIEFNYLCNFLQLSKTKKTYDNNKDIFHELISFRQKKINVQIANIKESINKKFS
tara:strand:- start:466 stop:1371 length:906 start_codon:yes stop_codon:yes gene_type:complete